MLIPLQSFTHVWLTLTLTTFLRALDKHLFPWDWKRGNCICFIILQSLCDVHWSMPTPLLSFWFNINHFVCFVGWLVLSEKMKEVFVLMETSLFYFGLSHILPTLLGRIVDFPVWCETQTHRKLQMSNPQGVFSPENRAHFPPSVTGAPPIRFSTFPAAQPQHQCTGTHQGRPQGLQIPRGEGRHSGK